MVKCSDCGANCAETDQFCGSCGKRIVQSCPNCRAALRPGGSFCTQCGAATVSALGDFRPRFSVGQPEDSARTNAPCASNARQTRSGESTAAGAERRIVTVMFVDLVASTTLANHLDPEDFRRLLSSLQNIMAGEIARAGGFVAQFLGDGVLAYFGFPNAYEDEAERAVRAALAIVAAIERSEAHAGWVPQVRVGIATGLVVVGEPIAEGNGTRPSVVGSTASLAARLQTTAGPGEILISATTRKLLGGRFELRGRGKHALKGFEEPTPLFQIMGEAPPQSRFIDRHEGSPDPLVGRDHELALLRERWRIAQGGEGQLVLLVGDAGIGKSRLVEALIGSISDDPCKVMRMQCSAIRTNSPWHPIVQLLSSEKMSLCDSVATIDSDIESSKVDLALINDLRDSGSSRTDSTMNMTPPQRRGRLLAALVALFREKARERALLVIVEDAHWADASTLEWILASVATIGDAAIMLVVTTRPGLEAGFMRHAVVTWLRLNRLPQGAVSKMIGNLAKEAKLPEAQRLEIVKRADGVPLFVEELTRALIDGTSITSVGTGRDGQSVPFNLLDSLSSRLDFLGEAKEFACVAAVIGRDFELTILAELSQRNPNVVESAIERLIASDVIHRYQGDSRSLYRFKHALLAEAAYEMLLRERRSELHKRLFFILQNRGGEAEEVLARHAELGGVLEAALERWSAASSRALERSAYQEALANLASALRIAERLPVSESLEDLKQGLYVHQGQALIATQGYSANTTLDAFRRALAVGGSSRNGKYLLAASYGHLAASYVAGHSTSEAAREFVRVTGLHGSSAAAQVAYRHLALALLHEGSIRDACEILEQTIADYNREEHHEVRREFGQDNRVAASAYLGAIHWLLGDPAKAERAAEEAIDWARELHHPPSVAYALNMGVCLTNVLLRKPERVWSFASELGELADRYCFGLWHAWARVDGGWARSFTESEGGIVDMDSGLRDKHAFGARRHDALNYQMLCDALLRAGRFEEAEAAISQAFLPDRLPDVLFASESHRLRAALSVSRGDTERLSVEADLTTAVQIAQSLRSPGLLLRAVRDMASYFARTGERANAQDLLEAALADINGGTGYSDVEEARAALIAL